VEGTAREVGDDGALVVETTDGTVRVGFGEIELLR
jgi:biotin protein ligase-like protein